MNQTTNVIPGSFDARFPFRAREPYANRQCHCATELEACAGCRKSAAMPEPTIGFRVGFERKDVGRVNIYSLGGARLREYLGTETARESFRESRGMARAKVTRIAAKAAVGQ